MQNKTGYTNRGIFFAECDAEISEISKIKTRGKSTKGANIHNSVRE